MRAATTTERRSRLDAATWAIVGIALGGLVIRGWLVTRSLVQLDRLFIPDDTYYTLTIARSIAQGHGPTVDGSTLTSGFQPLLGFLMTPVFWLTDSPDLALRADLVLLVLVDTATILLLACLARRLAGAAAAVAAAVTWACSPVAISMALGGLETSLAIFTQVGLVQVWLRARDDDQRLRWIVVGVVAGLAVLGRIDALALVAPLALLQLWRGSRTGLRTAAIAGSALVAPWWIWCTVQFGTPWPSSGEAVHHLAPYESFSRESMAIAAGAVAGGPFGRWGWARTEFVSNLDLGVVVFWAIVVGLVALAVVWLRHAAHHPERDAWTLAPALPLFAALLLVFYAWFALTWYFTRYLAPVAWVVTILIAVAIGTLVQTERSGREWHARRIAGALGFAVVGVVLVASMRTNVQWARSVRPPVARLGTGLVFDAATGFRETVETVLRQVPRGSTIAAYQSGALGYYGVDRVVINLDGAVNPDTAAKDDEAVARYLRARRVDGIVDVPMVVALMGLALEKQRPPARLELKFTASGQPSLRYQYARIFWPDSTAR